MDHKKELLRSLWVGHHQESLCLFIDWIHRQVSASFRDLRDFFSDEKQIPSGTPLFTPLCVMYDEVAHTYHYGLSDNHLASI